MENKFLSELYKSILALGIAEHSFTVTINPILEKDIEPRILEYWRGDYNIMLQTMIYGEAPDFDQLIERMKVLRNRFRAIL
jgi:hypothetical protein